jgi:putative PIN family toxin of toxin-antitoxin system
MSLNSGIDPNRTVNLTQKVVLDTNALVSAILSPGGNPAIILALVLDEKLQICYSAQIMAEYEEVLFRPKFNFETSRLRIILETIQETGALYITEISDTPMQDESDRTFYDTARCAGAFLITGNTKHYPQESFIFTPAEFVSNITRLEK